MAISKILHMKQAKSGWQAKHLANGLQYIMDPKKTSQGHYIGGNGCIPENALGQMLETKRHFGKPDKRQAYHLIISFPEGEATERDAFEILGQFVEEYLGADYEAVYAVHNDTDHIHGHIIFNSVRCTDGRKYDYPKGEWERRIQPLVNCLCIEHGLSILDMEEMREKRKQKKGGEGKPKAPAGRAAEKMLLIKKESVCMGEIPEAEFHFIFIPYRSRHLTQYQKKCFVRKYRAGKVKSGGRPWEYKASLQALEKLQEEYIFWTRHGIQGREDIAQAARQAERRLLEIRAEKKKLLEERKPYTEILALLQKLGDCEAVAALYREGYPEFLEEAKEYQKICGRLSELVYPLGKAREIEGHFSRQLKKWRRPGKQL